MMIKGRAFAWQEAHMTIATIYQKFHIILADPNYELQLKQALTIKPVNFYIRVIPRTKSPRLYAQPSSKFSNSSEDTGFSSHPSGTSQVADADQKPLYALYGSNTGTCKSFAQRIAADAPSYGFKATIGTLDSVAENLPRDGPVIIVTASFEGR
jgi:cytochrome P450 / NADPH-cytochrome P450 reductase